MTKVGKTNPNEMMDQLYTIPRLDLVDQDGAQLKNETKKRQDIDALNQRCFGI